MSVGIRYHSKQIRDPKHMSASRPFVLPQRHGLAAIIAPASTGFYSAKSKNPGEARCQQGSRRCTRLWLLGLCLAWLRFKPGQLCLAISMMDLYGGTCPLPLQDQWIHPNPSLGSNCDIEQRKSMLVQHMLQIGLVLWLIVNCKGHNNGYISTI